LPEEKLIDKELDNNTTSLLDYNYFFNYTLENG